MKSSRSMTPAEAHAKYSKSKPSGNFGPAPADKENAADARKPNDLKEDMDLKPIGNFKSSTAKKPKIGGY